jgi:hypothetical protein
MALFNAAELLEDKPEPKTIVCDFFKIPEGIEYPTITIEMSDKLRDAYRKADAKYRFAPRYTFEKGSRIPTGELSNDPVQFCLEILKVGYKDSEGLIDKPSRKAILALIRRELGFAKKLATKLVELFEHDELFLDEEEIEKN